MDEYEVDMMAEQLSRNALFFGVDGQPKIEGAFVVVVGMGGVGSHAAHMLARAGVGRMRLVDFDNVTLSSLNRHAVATRGDVGKSKVSATADHFLRTCPHLEVEADASKYEASQADRLLRPFDGTSQQPDYVLDCIDHLPTKADLMVDCQSRGLTLLSAMGAGGKADPTRLHIGSLRDANYDKLCVRLRGVLKQRRANVDKVNVCFSSEQSRVDLQDLTEEQKRDGASEFGAMDRTFRVRILPVMGCMPAAMGMVMASKCLCDLAEQPIVPEAVIQPNTKLAQNTLAKLKQREDRFLFNQGGNGESNGNGEAGGGGGCYLDKLDIAFCMTEVWRRRSAFSGG